MELHMADATNAADTTLATWLAAEHRLAVRVCAHGPLAQLCYEFVRFGLKMAWACVFAGLMLALIVGTWLWYPKSAAVARYDVITVAACAIQAGLLWAKLETWDEARVIAVFHVVGTLMEVFKTAVGSWVYPEAGVLRIGGVPLFTGFMYACIGSFMVRAWHLFDFRFERHPPVVALGLLSVAIYGNFYTHHFIADVRAILFVGAFVLLGPATIHYQVWQVHRRMPLLLAAVLAAMFIWIAENIGTFAAAWVYPHQRHGWGLVPVSKFGAWFLLMIISYTLVLMLKGDSLRRPNGR
jgi:uncharacterized membrane protein YoaT (DUF817 family)